ncbi:hypothetical protein [Pseudorhodoferax soli]|uniref:Uncharacterized protein n=1 Tax=Pseudorhodoferax soli TaxID=545864 RepID=A0A368XD72_9BURK|nr:hypothetical protein [Pseudorhodoferax soli]RCW65186.1 hypothetical protein DES41_113110 [Pseudorhodoferax soli]
MAWEWIWSMLGSGAMAAALVGIAGYMGRAQLAHWLNRDLEQVKADHQHELAQRRAQYERELEAYRTSLIAQVESVKAGQEVKKSLALLVAQKRFAALDKLHQIVSRHPSNVTSVIVVSALRKVPADASKMRNMREGQRELSEAISLITPFVSEGEVRALEELSSKCMQAIFSAATSDAEQFYSRVQEFERAINDTSNKVQQIVNGYFAKLHAMTL